MLKIKYLTLYLCLSFCYKGYFSQRKNTFFSNGKIKRVSPHKISNWLFDMWPFSNRAHLESTDCPDAIISWNLKISLGFSARASYNEIENWQVWLKFDLISILLFCWLSVYFHTWAENSGFSWNYCFKIDFPIRRITYLRMQSSNCRSHAAVGHLEEHKTKS